MTGSGYTFSTTPAPSPARTPAQVTASITTALAQLAQAARSAS